MSIRPSLDAALLLDHQDARGSRRMRDMLVARLDMADVAGLHRLAMLRAVAAVMHGDGALQQYEHLGAVIHVPDVRAIGPMQANGCAFDLGDRRRVPGLGGEKVTGSHELHEGGSSGRA